jgi:hypothetical protein
MRRCILLISLIYAKYVKRVKRVLYVKYARWRGDDSERDKLPVPDLVAVWIFAFGDGANLERLLGALQGAKGNANVLCGFPDLGTALGDTAR